MLRDKFIAPSINIEDLCDEAKGLKLNTETTPSEIKSAMSNSFGFGGTNASLILTKY
jgi:3-oxoacyl-[acyl-carrier-protein] synthase-1